MNFTKGKAYPFKPNLGMLHFAERPKWSHIRFGDDAFMIGVTREKQYRIYLFIYDEKSSVFKEVKYDLLQ